MFSKWFKKDQPKERKLNHPRDLKKGDMFQMLDSFSLPEQLKNKMFTVKEINTYQYQSNSECEFVIQNENGNILFLTIASEDGEEWANFSMKIQRDEVDVLFTLDQFAQIFDAEDELVSIERQGMLDGFERWIADEYVQSAHPGVGYFYNQDLRGQTVSRFVEDGGEKLEYIGLDSPDEEHSLNIEVWDDGETDVSLTLLRPLSDIQDLYPGNG